MFLEKFKFLTWIDFSERNWEKNSCFCLTDENEIVGGNFAGTAANSGANALQRSPLPHSHSPAQFCVVKTHHGGDQKSPHQRGVSRSSSRRHDPPHPICRRCRRRRQHQHPGHGDLHRDAGRSPALTGGLGKGLHARKQPTDREKRPGRVTVHLDRVRVPQSPTLSYYRGKNTECRGELPAGAGRGSAEGCGPGRACFLPCSTCCGSALILFLFLSFFSIRKISFLLEDFFLFQCDVSFRSIIFSLSARTPLDMIILTRKEEAAQWTPIGTLCEAICAIRRFPCCLL